MALVKIECWIGRLFGEPLSIWVAALFSWLGKWVRSLNPIQANQSFLIYEIIIQILSYVEILLNLLQCAKWKHLYLTLFHCSLELVNFLVFHRLCEYSNHLVYTWLENQNFQLFNHQMIIMKHSGAIDASKAHRQKLQLACTKKDR